jgi:RNA methyltransferase, TrmH family
MTEFTERTPRVVAARKLTRRAGRDAAGEFLAEGPQAVREALGHARELYVTAAAAARWADLVDAARARGVPVSPVTDRAAAALSETTTPQGLVARCAHLHVPLATALPPLAGPSAADRSAADRSAAGPSVADRSVAGPSAAGPSIAGRSVAGPPVADLSADPSAADPSAAGPPVSGRPGARGPRLVVVLADIRDPGNAGTVLRSADAAGADAVVLAGDSVDPYNGKAVRASAGSLFHLPVVRGAPLAAALDAARAAGLRVLAADGGGEADLDEVDLGGPTAWLFGNEAWGLPAALGALADARVRIPISPRAESLNLAAAAAVCLFASAREHRRNPAGPLPAKV